MARVKGDASRSVDTDRQRKLPKKEQNDDAGTKSGSKSNSNTKQERNNTKMHEDISNTSDRSVAKILTLLRSQPSNRSCCDCRCALIDPSNVFVSVCCPENSIGRGICQNKSRKIDNEDDTIEISLQDFHLTHRAFAPPNKVAVEKNGDDNSNSQNLYKYKDDPAISANGRFGGHGVFICSRCADAHRQLGYTIQVKRVVDSSLWTMDEVQSIAGNEQCWNIYEGFVPDSWKQRRPIFSSPISTRILFCRAKYEALAFCLPQVGPLAEISWRVVLRNHQKKNKNLLGKQSYKISASLKNIYSLSIMAQSNVPNKNTAEGKGKKSSRIPSRLIDYFCVISSSSQLLPSNPIRSKKQKTVDYSNLTSPEELKFWPHVTDCFPRKNTHGEMGYQDHISSFVMPDGCHPTLQPKPPCFFTFVLTMPDGSYLYGGSLQIYDEHVDAGEIKSSMRDSGYKNGFPKFLQQNDIKNNDTSTTDSSDVFFFPKCLVILSRYAFFDIFRSVLLDIYQISLIGAPLPIERYIANIVCEIPLPPQGQVKVEFGFSSDKKFRIERPPINELPMANFSYRPLFASLSVSNVMVVLGYLLQECKVVILSQHYSILTPVAEALLSAIFPFRWAGLYLPVAPLKMIEILDAPVPYLIGLNTEYFKMVDVRHRPPDAILVDLDRDVIYIGDIPLPEIPVRDAQKLSTALEEAAGSVYVVPNSGIKGCIMGGSKELVLVPNEDRPRYAYMTTATGLPVEMHSMGRSEVFSITDLAYGRFDDETDRINGFGSVDGQFTSTEETEVTNEKKKGIAFNASPMKRPRFMRNKKVDILSNNHLAMSQSHLLDIMAEPEGFSVSNIRNTFLRFTVATFAEYQDSLLSGSKRDLFDREKFIDKGGSQGGGSKLFLENILNTQLFQRFLEERIENPNLPEIRFFDESIVAKRNRSKKAIANGGKKSTPFLNDKTTWKVTKQFAPPPPNNFGLPDTEDSRAYRYGSFPALNAALFGRIRPPVTWPQHTNLDSVRSKYTRSDSEMKKTQNRIFKKVLAAPNVIAAAAKHTARNLESTLSALSIIPIAKPQDVVSNKTEGGGGGREGEGEGELPSPQRNVSTLTAADTIMMDTRRKQTILLDIIIQIQAICRGFLARLHCNAIKGEVLNTKEKQVQHELESAKAKRKNRRTKEKQVQHELESAKAKRKNKRLCKAAIGIQSFVRMYNAQKLANQLQKRRLCKAAAIVIQSFVRMYTAQKLADKLLKAIVEIQKSQRASVAQKKWRIMKHSAIVIAKNIRARRAQIIFHELKRIVTSIQARVRGMQIRVGIKDFVEKKILLYNSQIFLLWKHLHVSLTFRTKLWPDISGSHSFICLRLAESELIRLWEIADFPDRLTDAKGADEITRLGDVFGIGNEVYCRSIKCIDWINNCGSALTEYSTIENAFRIEEAERLQIYERLSSSVSVSKKGVPEKDILTMYHNFDILQSTPMKKVSLSKRIWTNLDESDRSASSMIYLFPELNNSLGISFQKPSSKGQRRFPKTRKPPLPSIDHVLWDRASIEGNTKRHVQEVAMIFITRVPSLTIKLDSICQRRSNSRYISFLEAARKVYGFQNLEQAQCSIIMQYLNKSCSAKLNPKKENENQRIILCEEKKC